jgi:ABC-2 type transport system ATP-binding protein
MDALSIKDLKKTYSNGFQALQGINLTIKKGDFFALLGPNGAGKSTTIGIITSLINKTSGTIKIFGVDIDKDFDKAKTYVGVVPQEFNFNIFETVEQILIQQAGYYGIERDVALSRVEKYLKTLGLWEKRHVKSMMLSGGMKRRLMIARALIHEPKLLILDEPTAGVDIELRRTMWDFIVDLNKNHGTTIILTTHYLEEAEQLSKNLAIINKGEIIKQGQTKRLLKELDSMTVLLDTKEELTEISSLNKYDCSLVDGQLQVVLHKGDTLTDLFLYLKKKGIEVVSMRNKSNRLEELFLSLTEEKQ